MKSFFKLLKPNNNIEWAVLLISFISYLIIGEYLALHTTISYDREVKYDIYYGFDNIAHRTDLFSHPFIGAIISPLFRLWAKIVGEGLLFRATSLLPFVLAISIGILVIYKFIRNIVELALWPSLLIVIIYAMFFTNIVLSFTMESFPLSLMLLSILYYYYSICYKEKRNINILGVGVFSFLIGGVTIINAIKPVFITVLYRTKKNFIRISIACIIAIIALMLIAMMMQGVDDVGRRGAFSTIIYNTYTIEEYIKYFFNAFYGGNIFFQGYIVKDFPSALLISVPFHALISQTSQFENIILVIVYICFFLEIWSVIINRKNRIVQLITLTFLSDIFLHIILKFGIEESNIFGGHFLFVHPILFAYLLKRYQQNKAVYYTLMVVFILFFISLVWKNLDMLYNLYLYGLKYYPA